MGVSWASRAELISWACPSQSAPRAFGIGEGQQGAGGREAALNCSESVVVLTGMWFPWVPGEGKGLYPSKVCPWLPRLGRNLNPARLPISPHPQLYDVFEFTTFWVRRTVVVSVVVLDYLAQNAPTRCPQR